jgi:hypothetical protein
LHVLKLTKIYLQHPIQYSSIFQHFQGHSGTWGQCPNTGSQLRYNKFSYFKNYHVLA